MTILLDANIPLFFGRFHSLVVHLPIGFIILAAIFELISWKKKIDLDGAIAYGLLIGAVFGLIAIILGLMLASDGGYNEEALNIHKWTGISTSLIAFIAFFLKSKVNQFDWAKKAYQFTLVTALLMLSTAGHYGGNLTHGSTYLLEHAPNSIRAIAGLKPPRERITSLDSALVYEDVVHQIFDTKCNVCHNNDKAKGELLLIDRESIMKGGENGPVIVSGDPSKSELYRRVTLDPNHDDFMPTEGRTPLAKEEIALLEWWIEQGAPFDKKVVDLTLSDRIKTYLKEVGIGQEESFLASLKLPSISQETYDSISAKGFKIKTIANNSTWLDVNYSSYNLDPVNEKKLITLLEAKENITWLDLSGSHLDDKWFSHIGQLTNLTRLKVNQTMITSESIKHLESLKNLEYLNIYGNQISDEAIESILQLSKLKKLFIWQTNISEEGIARIKEATPELQVEIGV